MTIKDKINRRITLPISESIYEVFMANSNVAHKMIKEFYENIPELFPVALSLLRKLEIRYEISIKQIQKGS